MHLPRLHSLNLDLEHRKPLSLHAVSFGNTAYSASLRKMVAIAEDVARAAPRDPMAPLVPCGYTDAMDTVSCMRGFLRFGGLYLFIIVY